METKVCTVCNKDQPLTEYYNCGQGRQRSECKECHRKYVTQRNKENREHVHTIKEQASCAKCGEKRPYVLDYHHLNPNTKVGTVSRQMVHASQNKVLEEIPKCVPLCANCHREYHYLKQLTGISLQDYILNPI